MKPTYKEIERQLSESRREFWAADVTINNLELRLAEMEAQLANAESKRASLAADNEKAMEAMRQADVAVKLAHEKFSALAEENAKLKEFISLECMVFGDSNNLLVAEPFIPQTPATDVFLAEVRAQGVDMAMEHMQSSGSLTFGDCYISLNEFAAKLRQEADQ